MTQTESLIRFILGPIKPNIRPLTYAVDIAIDLMFNQNIPMDDILVTKDIYPAVSKMLKTRKGTPPSVVAVTRQIIRLSNQCWDSLVARDIVIEYIGAPIKHIHAPRDMIFYLAFYSHLKKPFYVAITQEPALLF